MSAFRQVYDKTVALGYRMDVLFYMLRIGLFYSDYELIKTNLEKAHRYRASPSKDDVLTRLFAPFQSCRRGRRLGQEEQIEDISRAVLHADERL